MKKIVLDIEKFKVNGNVTLEKRPDGSYLTTWPKEGGMLLLAGEPMKLGDVDWSGATHLVLDITGLQEFNPVFTAVFMGGSKEEDPSTIFNAGAIPGMRVQVSFAFEHLDSNRMYIPRTPGRLKQMIMGRGVKLEQVTTLILATRECHEEQKVIIHDIYLTVGEPEYKLEARPQVDRLGQWTVRDWPGKTKSEEEMRERLLRESRESADREFEDWSRFGGDKSVTWDATGYFHTHFDGKRWYLVDPEGHPFLSTGLDCCCASEGTVAYGIEQLFEELPDREKYAAAYKGGDGIFLPEDAAVVNFVQVNLMRAYGEDWERKWEELTRSRLIDWHFNTIGNWSDRRFIKNARLPYVWPLSNFPQMSHYIFRDFPDVFSEEYEEKSKAFASQLEEFAGDPYMIGYFLLNEPNWSYMPGLMIAEKALEDPADTATKEAFIQWLQEKYGTADALSEAWQKNYTSFEDLRQPQYRCTLFSSAANEDTVEFSRIMIRRFVGVPSLACKAVDPDHMNLGMRYSMLVDPVILSGAEYFDVFSLNGYQSSPYEEVQKAGEITGKPVIIGEFHFGAPDRGVPSAGIYSVATQADRGLAYREYFEGGMESPYFVGAHYFTLYDSPALGRFDGENMQIGLLDVCSHPYEECIAGMKACNEDIYRMADGTAPKAEKKATRIPRLMGF